MNSQKKIHYVHIKPNVNTTVGEAPGITTKISFIINTLFTISVTYSGQKFIGNTSSLFANASQLQFSGFEAGPLRIVDLVLVLLFLQHQCSLRLLLLVISSKYPKTGKILV
uniref:Uncharacterized protein n=1 Tax=Glossina pallidipes TaxID=7398 RepID=A0A1A9ZNG2_GLOPL